MPSSSQFKTKEEYNKWMQEYRNKNRIKFRIYQKEYNKKRRKIKGCKPEIKWAKNNKEKKKVHKILQKAVKIGKIIKKPCSFCNNPISVAHHSDYSKPLEVTWLCHIHHYEIHHNK